MAFIQHASAPNSHTLHCPFPANKLPSRTPMEPNPTTVISTRCQLTQRSFRTLSNVHASKVLQHCNLAWPGAACKAHRLDDLAFRRSLPEDVAELDLRVPQEVPPRIPHAENDVGHAVPQPYHSHLGKYQLGCRDAGCTQPCTSLVAKTRSQQMSDCHRWQWPAWLCGYWLQPHARMTRLLRAWVACGQGFTVGESNDGGSV